MIFSKPSEERCVDRRDLSPGSVQNEARLPVLSSAHGSEGAAPCRLVPSAMLIYLRWDLTKTNLAADRMRVKREGRHMILFIFFFEKKKK